ncbi:MAG: hypothetical protein HY815_21420, partial [Candidatus Riflebacteria bacterium]|nr:hypothetical protein [Candidatus Riflebacteria bacterium]
MPSEAGQTALQSCHELFATGGVSHAAGANAPLALNEPESLWLVREGWMDIFAVPPPRGEVPSARVRLCRVEAGQIVPGAGPSQVELIAVGSQGCQVFHLRRQQLEARLADGAIVEAVAPPLEEWIRRLTGGVAPGPVPKGQLRLEADRTTQVKGLASASPAAGTLWVVHEQGASRFLGLADPPLGKADGRFPVSDAGWVTATAEGADLNAVSTRTVLADRSIWSGLERFHQAVVACVIVNVTRRDEADRARIQRRLAMEQRLNRVTMSRLAGVAGAEDPEELEARAGLGPALEEDPLLAACRLVGASLGVAIQAPIGGGEKRRRGDPVSAIARASRIRSRRVQLAGDWWSRDNGPLVAFLGEDERPVALIPASRGHYELTDPATGRRERLTGTDAASVSPFGYSFYRPFPERLLNLWRLVRFALTGTWPDWARLVLLGLAGSVVGMVTPIVTGRVFDLIVPGAMRHQLVVVVLGLAVCAVSNALFHLTQGIAMLRLETRMDGSVEAALWDRLLNLSTA